MHVQIYLSECNIGSGYKRFLVNFIKGKKYKTGIVAHAYNPRTQDINQRGHKFKAILDCML